MVAVMGNAFSKAMQTSRATIGQPIVWKGGTYNASIRIPKRRDAGFEMASIPVNTALADIRFVTVSPADFPSGLFPREGDTIAINAEPGNEVFQVAFSASTVINTVTHSAELIVYRQSPTNAASVAPVGETGAGSRKNYELGVNPYA